VSAGLLQFLSSDDVAGMLQQQGQDFHWLPLQPDLHSLFAEFPRLWVELEDPKAIGWLQ
jgi:hypothetical protein